MLSKKLIRQIFISIVFIINGTQEKTAGIKGYPILSNCEDEVLARKKPFPIKDSFVISPKWSDEEEFSKYPRILKHYKWNYKMVKITEENGKMKEEIVTIKKFIIGNFSLNFPSFSLKPGFYQIDSDVEPENKKLKRFISTKCYVMVVALPPVVIITGGNYRMVPSYNEITFKGDESIDLNKPFASLGDFDYYWTCTQSTFCINTSVSNRNIFIIPPEHVINKDTFKVTLKVTTSFKTSAEAVQKIEVRDNAAALEIICQKNCPPVTYSSNFKFKTFTIVTCKINCKNIDDNDYEWEIIRQNRKKQDFDYNKNTEFGRRGTKFVIKKDTLQPGNYQVSVELKGDNVPPGKATIYINYASPPNVTDCKTKPREGTTLGTFFRLDCHQDSDLERYFYQLFVTKPEIEETYMGELVVNGYSPGIFNTEFLLPTSRNHKFIVRVSKDDGPFIELPIYPVVEQSLVTNSSTEITKFLKKYHSSGNKFKQSISGLLYSTDETERNTGIRMFQALVNELINVDNHDQEIHEYIEDLKYTAVEDLLRVPTKTINDIIQMAEILAKLMSHHDVAKSDPLLAKFSSTICRKMMQKFWEKLNDETFPLNFEEQTKKVTSVVAQCVEANTNPHYDIFDKTLNISDDNPENYVDYTDDYYKHLENLEETTYNIIKVAILTAKALAKSTAEELVENYGHHSSTIVAKNTGKALADWRIVFEGNFLVPSSDWAKSDQFYDVFVTTWQKDLMWWNQAYTRVATNIINVQFWHSTCKEKIKTFNNPVKLVLTLNNETNFNITIVEDELVRPPKSLNYHDLNPYIKVRRVSLGKGQSLRIHFYNLSKSDAFDVVITEFKYPTIEDFADNRTVSTDNDFLLYLNLKLYDIWCFIGILPSRKISNGGKMTFRVSFLASYCIHWQALARIWKPICLPGKGNTRTVISCDCTNFSVIAGYMQNVPSIPQELLTQEFALELQSCYIIFATVVTTFGFFCFLIIFTVSKIQKKINFLVDNNPAHRYAYLICVKTGNRYNSGTTSNIMIQIFGEQGSTEPHVLNYPESKMHMLQNCGEDLFILTTDHHLGKLLSIALWSNFSGHNPSWYCEKVIIFDIQADQEWYFAVNLHFSLLKGANYIIVNTTETELSKKQSLKTVKIWNQFHTWYLRGGEENFSYVKRLTVILSTVTFIYMMVLILHGVPKFQLKDGFDHEIYNVTAFTFSAAFASSFTAFVFHMGISWVFRFSEIQFSTYEQEAKMHFEVTVICWCCTIFMILFSMTFLIVTGFWVPHNASFLWLTSSIIAIILEVVVFENISSIVQSFFYKSSTVTHIWHKIDFSLLKTELQRLSLFKKFGKTLLRPYLEHMYKPLEPIEIKEKQMIARVRSRLSADFIDFIMFSIYVIILQCLILFNKDSGIVASKRHLQNVFDGKYTRTMGFTEVTSIEQFYKYINITLIPAIYPTEWYLNFGIDPGTLTDHTNKIIGVIRLRQHRIMGNFCTIPEVMTFTTTKCYPEFTPLYEETGTFAFTWKELGHIITHWDRMSYIWKHQTSAAYKTPGQFANYPDGGYIAYFGRTIHNTYLNFLRLFRLFCIDQNTRSVIIEFLTYNHNYNVFNNVKLLFEQSATGHVVSTIQINVARMVFVQKKWEFIVGLFFILFIFWVLISLYKLSISLVGRFRSKTDEAGDWLWLLLDLVIIILSIIYIILFFVRLRMFDNYLEKVKSNEFVNYFPLLYIEDVFSFFGGFLLCMALARLWRFLRLCLLFRRLEKTLSMASSALWSITVSFALLLTGFGLTGIFIFGNEFTQLSSFMKIIPTLITLLLKLNQFNLSDYTDYRLSYPYFTMYLVVALVIRFFYTTVIIMGYLEAKLQNSFLQEKYTIINFLTAEFKYLPKLIAQKFTRLRGGVDEKVMVQPKADEFGYVNCLWTVSRRMKAMKFITYCYIRNFTKTEIRNNNERDIKLMFEICRLFVLKNFEANQHEIFFKGHFVGEKVRIVDGKRMKKIAEIISMLLQPKNRRTMFEDQTSEPEEKVKDIEKEVKYQALIKKQIKALERCYYKLKMLSNKVESVDFLQVS